MRRILYVIFLLLLFIWLCNDDDGAKNAHIELSMTNVCFVCLHILQSGKMTNFFILSIRPEKVDNFMFSWMKFKILK